MEANLNAYVVATMQGVAADELSRCDDSKHGWKRDGIGSRVRVRVRGGSRGLVESTAMLPGTLRVLEASVFGVFVSGRLRSRLVIGRDISLYLSQPMTSTIYR